MYVFGGIDSNGEVLNSVEFFDCTQYQWTKIDAKGTAPHGRHGHTAAIVQNHMFVLGGSESADLENPKECKNNMAILNLDLHEWLPVGETGKNGPENSISQYVCEVKGSNELLKVYWKSPDTDTQNLSFFNIKDRVWIPTEVKLLSSSESLGCQISHFQYTKVTAKKPLIQAPKKRVLPKITPPSGKDSMH